MALIRNRADLILSAAMRDNPTITQTLQYGNCYVYGYGSFSSQKGFCDIKGRYGAGVRGKVRCKYRKLDVSVLLKEIDPWVYFTGALSTVDLIPAINARFGLDLTASDIVDHPLQDAGKTAIIEMAASSTLYRGTVTINVGNSLPILDTLVAERSLDPQLSYWPIQEQVRGAFLSVGHDYTQVGLQLLGAPTGALSDEKAIQIASLLGSVDGTPWVAVSGASYSLKNALVHHNGVAANAPAEFAPLLKGLFSHVLILSVDRDHNTNMDSTPLAFHYNIFM